ncbi:carbohydrate binding domain-containing protein [Paenibacillus flagellatus]|uniref:CBM-cenC domain-containing protein n=1 Tax=Paenibacillus flagellatus TaxID=2211139 RepID=A0A2V5K3K5_9BACL|nr:carbohydrate binding domain-containing protein [Paenibacillus flagellatus]PYI53818.1 hypothetical protein DLM86_14770 [Paenibacillus flagellatus]
MNLSIRNTLRNIRSLGAKAALTACLLTVLTPLLVPAATPHAAANGVGDDLMVNGGFEQTEGGYPLPWIPFNGWSNPELALTPAAARTGTNGFQIQTTQQSNPWIAQEIRVEAGAEYEVSAWLKATGVQGSGIGFKLEFYKGEERTSAGHLIDRSDKVLAGDLTGDWQQLKMQVTAPPEATIVVVFLRLYGTGTVFFDDASFVLRKLPPMIEMKTDHLFYYSEWEEGHVAATFRPHDGQTAGKQAEARVYRVSTGVSIATYGLTSAASPLAFDFDPTLMVEEEPYKVEVSLRDSSGTLLETAEKTIYRFDRPTMLREDGNIRINGEPFFPVAAYHVRQTDYPYLSEAGVNTVQGGVTNKVQTMRGTLDAAWQNGLRVLVPLYYNMNVQENYAMIEQFVTELKDHPAVLAWMIMDEPVQNNKSQEELAEAYRIIRSIDKAHPAYLVEAPADAYETVAQVTDILATDVYPLPFFPISIVGERTALAKQAAGEGKPVWNVLQAMYNPPVWTHLPTIGELRNMAYQSLLSGGQGLAYYSFNEDGFALRQSELWPGLVKFRDELELFGRLITEGERLGAGQATDVRWTLWKDGDELYAAVVNTSGAVRTATVPLGTTGYRAELLYGDSRSTLDEQSDSLTIGLGPEQSLLYRIVPFATMVSQAIGEADEAAGLSTEPFWVSTFSQLFAGLDAAEAALTGTPSAIGDAIEAALDAWSTADDLTNWAELNGAGGTKEEMLNALDRIRELLAPIAAANVRADLTLAAGRIYGQQEPNELAVTLHNGTANAIQDVQVELRLPEPFGLPQQTRAFSSIGGGQGTADTFDFGIGVAVPEDRYRLQAVIAFEYADRPGTRITVGKSVYADYSDLLDAVTVPASFDAKEGGAFPFAVTISSSIARALNVALDPDLAPGMTIDLPASLPLPANGSTTVTGTVYVPENAADGANEAAIDVSADGHVVRTVPVTVNISKNLLANPGFETASPARTAPNGWGMRDGVWTQDEKHGGQYAVSLLPDPANTWNVIASGLIPTKPGYKYALRGWVKNGSSSGSASIGLRQVKEDGASTINYTWKSAQPLSDWTSYELELTPAANAKYVQVFLLSDTLTDGPAWFDDLYVDEIPVEPEFVLDAEAAPASIASNRGGAFPFELQLSNNAARELAVEIEPDLPSGVTMQLAASAHLAAFGQTTVTGTVYVPTTVTDGVYEATIRIFADGQLARSVSLPIVIDSNLLVNPGFEQATSQGTAPAGWLMRQGLWVQDVVHGGQHAVSLAADPNNASNYIVSDLIPVVPGSPYALKGWVKNGSAAGGVSIGLRQVKEDRVSTVKYTWRETLADTDWTHYELSIAPSSTARYVQVFLKSDTTADGSAWFDDLTVEEISAP